MKTRGAVCAGNPRLGLYAIQTQSGFMIIEVLSGDVEIGDVLVWNSHQSLGEEIYCNTTKGSQVDVYVQNVNVSRSGLPDQLRL